MKATKGNYAVGDVLLGPLELEEKTLYSGRKYCGYQRPRVPIGRWLVISCGDHDSDSEGRYSSYVQLAQLDDQDQMLLQRPIEVGVANGCGSGLEYHRPIKHINLKDPRAEEEAMAQEKARLAEDKEHRAYIRSEARKLGLVSKV